MLKNLQISAFLQSSFLIISHTKYEKKPGKYTPESKKQDNILANNFAKY